jgi:hypothetical protein
MALWVVGNWSHRVMGRILALVLRMASVPVGVAVGLWTAQLTPAPYQCPKGLPCLLMNYFERPTFATWQCALFGSGAAAVLLLLSVAASRLPSAPPVKAS